MTQAVLLAAGRANRLLPLTERRPKGMLLVGGRPLLEHAASALREVGVTKLVIVIGDHGERIQSFFQDGGRHGLSIEYAHQAEPTGTADALRAAIPLLDGPTLVVSGHAYIDAKLLAGIAKTKGDAMLVATAGDDYAQVVPTVKGRRLTATARRGPVIGSTRISTGILRVTPAFLDHLEETDETDVELALGSYAADHEVTTVPADGPWHPVVDPWHVLRLNETVLDAMTKESKNTSRPDVRGAVHIGSDTTIAPSATIIGPATIGDGCTIGDYTVIGPYVSIRNNTVVGAHCEVRRSILNNNVLVDSRSLVRGSILDDGVRIAPAFVCDEQATAAGPLGCIIGRDSRIRAGTRLEGGSILDPETQA